MSIKGFHLCLRGKPFCWSSCETPTVKHFASGTGTTPTVSPSPSRSSSGRRRLNTFGSRNYLIPILWLQFFSVDLVCVVCRRRRPFVGRGRLRLVAIGRFDDLVDAVPRVVALQNLGQHSHLRFFLSPHVHFILLLLRTCFCGSGRRP